MCTTPGSVCTRGCYATLLGWRAGRWAAVGVVYTRSTPRETAEAGHYKHTWSLLHNSHLSLTKSRTTHPQTNLHTSVTNMHWVTPLWGFSTDCELSYQPLCTRSPQGKRKKEVYPKLLPAIFPQKSPLDDPPPFPLDNPPLTFLADSFLSQTSFHPNLPAERQSKWRAC